MSKRIGFLVYVFSLFILLESLLRIQQDLGPIYDLNCEGANFNSLSDILNHKNPPGEQEYSIMLQGKKFKFKRCYDENGIRINKLRPAVSNDKAAFKVVFMGDSTLEGYDDEHTIPQYIWNFFQGTNLASQPINLLNSGCGSYSPSIYIPQAKRLIPLLKPDFVVVLINENDLLDDTTRYKNLTVRDSNNNIIAVRCTPINFMFYKGFVRLKQQPLYLVRLCLKIYHTRIFMPLTIRNYNYRNKMDRFRFYYLDLDKIPKGEYTEEAEYFRKNVEELARTLINLMGDRKRILFIYHPFFRGEKGKAVSLYTRNTITSDTLRRVLDKLDVPFYNSASDLKKSFTGNLKKFYLPSQHLHFNFEGLRIYSTFIAEKLLPMIEHLIAEKRNNI